MINQVLLNCTVTSSGAVLAPESHHIHGTTVHRSWEMRHPLAFLCSEKWRGKLALQPWLLVRKNCWSHNWLNVQCSALRGVLVRGGEDLSCQWVSQFWVMVNRGLSFNPSQTWGHQPSTAKCGASLCGLPKTSTSSNSGFCWWSLMIGRLHVELYIFIAKQRTTRLFLPTSALTK